ncbi:MAG: hypothetical protein DDT40_00319 [candidate division WS2 bacterium]|nr:hypothetical protein [Candidatus Psychracetigena formicireducens]
MTKEIRRFWIKSRETLGLEILDQVQIDKRGKKIRSPRTLRVLAMTDGENMKSLRAFQIPMMTNGERIELT